MILNKFHGPSAIFRVYHDGNKFQTNFWTIRYMSGAINASYSTIIWYYIMAGLRPNAGKQRIFNGLLQTAQWKYAIYYKCSTIAVIYLPTSALRYYDRIANARAIWQKFPKSARFVSGWKMCENFSTALLRPAVCIRVLPFAKFAL